MLNVCLRGRISQRAFRAFAEVCVLVTFLIPVFLLLLLIFDPFAVETRSCVDESSETLKTVKFFSIKTSFLFFFFFFVGQVNLLFRRQKVMPDGAKFLVLPIAKSSKLSCEHPKFAWCVVGLLLCLSVGLFRVLATLV